MTDAKPLLTPNQVAVLTDQLSKLHAAIADADRIERCGFECGDIRATLHALSVTIQTMLTHLGNVPQGLVPQMQGQPQPTILRPGGSGGGGAPIIGLRPHPHPIHAGGSGIGSGGGAVSEGGPIPPGGHAVAGQGGQGYE